MNLLYDKMIDGMFNIWSKAKVLTESGIFFLFGTHIATEFIHRTLTKPIFTLRILKIKLSSYYISKTEYIVGLNFALVMIHFCKL